MEQTVSNRLRTLWLPVGHHRDSSTDTGDFANAAPLILRCFYQALSSPHISKATALGRLHNTEHVDGEIGQRAPRQQENPFRTVCRLGIRQTACAALPAVKRTAGTPPTPAAHGRHETAWTCPRVCFGYYRHARQSLNVRVAKESVVLDFNAFNLHGLLLSPVEQRALLHHSRTPIPRQPRDLRPALHEPIVR